jgi:hypothetical protein
MAHAHQDFCEGHHPLPNGDCWLYVGLRCEEHESIFWHGPGSLMDFGGSPGHYIMKNPGKAVPSKQDFMVYDDRKVGHIDTPEKWLELYKKAQAELGPALTRSEYLRQQAEFEKADAAKLKTIAADPRAAFREEAKLLLAEYDKPAGDDVVKLGEAERAVQEGRYADALAMLRHPPKNRDLNVVRVHELLRWIDWVAWCHLVEAKSKDAYKEVVDRFPGTEACKVAEKEIR